MTVTVGVAFDVNALVALNVPQPATVYEMLTVPALLARICPVEALILAIAGEDEVQVLV